MSKQLTPKTPFKVFKSTWEKPQPSSMRLKSSSLSSPARARGDDSVTVTHMVRICTRIKCRGHKEATPQLTLEVDRRGAGRGRRWLDRRGFHHICCICVVRAERLLGTAGSHTAPASPLTEGSLKVASEATRALGCRDCPA
jgi:hypothetical protein